MQYKIFSLDAHTKFNGSVSKVAKTTLYKQHITEWRTNNPLHCSNAKEKRGNVLFAFEIDIYLLFCMRLNVIYSDAPKYSPLKFCGCL